MNERAIRYHSSDDMTGLGEFRSVMEPVAVVLRQDGSVDVYGNVAVIDQASHNRSYTWITGHDAELHEHRFQGQMLRHSHAGGDLRHGYYEHPEDAGSR